MNTTLPTQPGSESKPGVTGKSAEAAAVLASGGLVVLPTETVYALVFPLSSTLVAGATIGAVLAKLTASVPPAAWVPATAQEVETTTALTDRTHRRILSRLTPGPVGLLVEQPATAIASARAALGMAGGIIDDGVALAIRRVSNPVAQEVIARAGVPVGIVEISTGQSRWGRTAVEAAAAVRSAGGVVLATVDGGVAPSTKPATVLRLLSAGGWKVERAGAYEERYLRKQLARTILFVCTGNTCRSPMAEAIASDLIGKDPTAAADTKVVSAGTGAGSGAPAASEGLKALEGLGITPSLKGSKPLTRQLIAEAEVIYAMTAQHRRAILAIDPTAAAKTHVLDPDGEDVADPLGFSQSVYTETAERIRDLISKRLKELDV